MAVTINKTQLDNIKAVKKATASAAKAAQPAIADLASQEVAQVVTKPKMKGGVVTEEQMLVDEAAQIQATLSKLEVPAMLSRLDEIKKIFQGKAKSLDQEQEATFTGTTGRMVFSKARVDLEITDKDKLVSSLSQDVFNQVAKVTATDMKKYLSQDEISSFTEKVYGSRTCKLIESIA